MINAPEPDMQSTTWPIVLQFAKWMEYKLSLNRHKGDAKGWRQMGMNNVFKRLHEETEELENAWEVGGFSIYSVVEEAADVANFAMFAADTACEPKS